jgi:dUTP pyrophosphatase
MLTRGPLLKTAKTRPDPILVPMTVLPHGEGLELPDYATAGAAGCDLRAALTEPLTLPPGGRTLVPTGIALAIPEGFEGQVRMRSGLAIRNGLTLLNAPGTIDSDYRGEVKVILANLGAEPVTLTRGERIAQLVFAPVARAKLARAEALAPTAREDGGFGSTGRT